MTHFHFILFSQILDTKLVNLSIVHLPHFFKTVNLTISCVFKLILVHIEYLKLGLTEIINDLFPQARLRDYRPIFALESRYLGLLLRYNSLLIVARQK